MKQMWSDLQQEMTTTPASSEIGRLAQLLKAAKVEAQRLPGSAASPPPDRRPHLAGVRWVKGRTGSIAQRRISALDAPGAG